MNPSQVLSNQKNILLETYKKNGEAKRTPVWFIEESGIVYIRTGANSWKAKRIRRNPSVRFAPCSFSGRIKGDWLNGNAIQIEGPDAQRMSKKITSKHGIMGWFVGVTRNKNIVAFSIKPS